MSKIYRPNMTAQDVLSAFQDDKSYAAKAKELSGILSAIDSRVGLVETQSKADKLFAQAGSAAEDAKAEGEKVREDRSALDEERNLFEKKAREKREEIDDLRKSAAAANRRAAAREGKIEEAFEARESAVQNREQALTEREAKLEAGEISLLVRRTATEQCLTVAIDSLKAV